MTGSTLYHVHFNSGGDHDFGSIAAIFELFSAETLGIAQQSLYDYGITPERSYKNKVCTIRKGNIRRKPGGRKLPKTI